MAKAIVIYGTGSGNAELVAGCIAEGLSHANLEAEAIRVELTNPEAVSGYDLVVLVSSTWNVGQLQDYFVPFNKEFSKLSMPGKPMAVVGLGDSKNYDIFCGAADILEATVAKVGGKLVLPTVRLDGPPHKILDNMVIWGQQLGEAFTHH